MKIREILVLHHSHLDIGYTHSQPMLWELHREFIDQALDLLDDTESWSPDDQPRWTCEVTAPVMRWLDSAASADIDRFAAYLKEGRIGISALEYNTTPLCNAEQLIRQLYPAQQLRDRFGIPINTANQHDINGIPWPLVDILLDSGVEFLTMAINVHLGGAAIGDRPAIFRWQGPSGRDMLVLNGPHYTMFDQILNTIENSTARMAEGLPPYLDHLASFDYPHDFIYLSSTNAPICWDNSPPNWDVAKLIRQWNKEGRQPRIRYVTPAMLLERIRQIPTEQLPVYRGDWTDYWNFGAGSTAAITGLNQSSKPLFFTSDMLSALNGPESPPLRSVRRRAWDQLNLFDEHTWGADISMQHQSYFSQVQAHLKDTLAYEARELINYLLLNDLDNLAGNPASAWKQTGALLVNSGPLEQQTYVSIPQQWRESQKRVRTARFGNQSRGSTMRFGDPATNADFAETELCGPVTVAPYSWKIMPLVDLSPAPPNPAVRAGADFIESPFYRLTFNPKTGRITGLLDRKRNWQLLDTRSPWTFFQYVHEKPDPLIDPGRTAYYERNLVTERYDVDCWKPGWSAQRQGAAQFIGCRVKQDARGAALHLQFTAESVPRLEQRIMLNAMSPLIELTARFDKKEIHAPEATYFAFPLNLPDGWRSHFDTAGIPTELDRDQLPGCARDWVTVESYVSVHHQDHGVTLYCPDAPLVQIGDFNFGRKQPAIERGANPLLLAWPLNNYWDTNFRATQPGPIEVNYAFSSHDAFDPITACQEGQQLCRPLLVHPAIHGNTAQAGTLLEVTGESVQFLHLKRAENGRSLIARFINLSPTRQPATFKLHTGVISAAYLATPLETPAEKLEEKNGMLAFEAPPRQITTIKLELAQ